MIRIKKLKKSFSDNTVLNELSLTVKDGEITALVGKNGSGKSTLIRLIAGLLKQDGGKISITSNQKIGVLLGGDVNLYKNLTANEIIHFFGELHGLSETYINRRIDELEDILCFKSFIDKRAGTLSRGMRQKIAIVISIIHDPAILLLDEPSTGLDIEASNDVINFIRYLKSENKTILIATHNIFEISDLCDSIAFIKNGKISKKVDTAAFFRQCPRDEKSSLLIREM